MGYSKSSALVTMPHIPVEDCDCLIRLPDSGRVRIHTPDNESIELTVDGHEAHWTPGTTGYHTIVWTGKSQSITRTVPVVWKPLYFFGWNIPPAGEASCYPLLTDCVIVRRPEEATAWREQGSRVLGFVFQRRKTHIDLKSSDESIVAGLVARWREPLEWGADGIWVDELGAYPDAAGLRAARLEMAALAELRRLFPGRILMCCVGGNLLPEYAAGHKAADAILISETYGEFINMAQGTKSFPADIAQRVSVMRSCDLLFERGYHLTAGTPDSWRRHGGIIMLSTNHVGNGIQAEPAVARLEYNLRYLKKLAPELPGMAFYQGSNEPDYYRQVFTYEQQERLLEKYFIRPVLDLRELFLSCYEPVANQSVQVHLGLHNLGGMKTGNIKIRLAAIDENHVFTEIAATTVDIGVGFRTLNGPADVPLTLEKHFGNTYCLLQNRTFVADAGHRVVSFDWEPPKSGWFKLVATVEPAAEYTSLDGCLELMIKVL